MSIDHAYASTIAEFKAAQAAGVPVEFHYEKKLWQKGNWQFLFDADRYRIAPSHAAKVFGPEPIEQPGALAALVDAKLGAGSTGGVKYDDGKADISLLPPEALVAIAEVFTFGAKKYAADNWRGGFKWRRVVSAILRHLFAWSAGQDKDPETGLSHIAHVGCNVMFLLTFIITKTGTDDRYKTYKE